MMSKFIFVIYAVASVVVIACAFMFGREYQANRFLMLTSKVSQERFCTSKYYILNRDSWADMDSYCFDYNEQAKESK